MTDQMLRLHTAPVEPHARLVDYLNVIQGELDELVHDVVGDCGSEEGLPVEDMDLHDKYAMVQNMIDDLRAPVLDHAWVAGRLDWKVS